MEERVQEALERVIERELEGNRQAPVERAIFGHAEPKGLAAAFERCCAELLGADVRAGLFYRSSIGAVAGVELNDRRRAVLKAYQPDRSRARLAEVVRLQRRLEALGCFAPAVLAGPAPLARGHIIIEAYVTRGHTRNAHEPVVRRALAHSWHAVSAALEPEVAVTSLPAHLVAQLEPGRLWPTPHSKLFDFEATRQGAEEIDALAAAALKRREPAGRIVLGHSDWRAEHVHFEGDRPVAAFDWDSLCKGQEAELVGFIAHAFCADWTRSDCVQAPTLDEARAFVAEYEAARGAPFGAAERRLLAAAFAYSIAYTARCGHAYGRRDRERPGTFHELLARYGQHLFEL
jgi:hypothetical protein